MLCVVTAADDFTGRRLRRILDEASCRRDEFVRLQSGLAWLLLPSFRQ